MGIAQSGIAEAPQPVSAIKRTRIKLEYLGIYTGLHKITGALLAEDEEAETKSAVVCRPVLHNCLPLTLLLKYISVPQIVGA